MTLAKATAIAVIVLITATSPAWSAQAPAASKALSVDQLAAKPDAYLGKVVVLGRVAAATPGKGFTLIDSAKCATCTTECLTDKNTKRVPFIWGGMAPAVKDVIRVEGTLTRTAKGFTFTAERLAKP